MRDLILVSACLCGVPCRYDGGTCVNLQAVSLVAAGRALPVCPEALGGLSTPRMPAELQGESDDVLRGKALVINKEGVDVTSAYVAGAKETLAVCKEWGITRAYMKTRSPSCGCGILYDGTFTSTLKEGWGVTAYLLKENGVSVCPMDSND